MTYFISLEEITDEFIGEEKECEKLLLALCCHNVLVSHFYIASLPQDPGGEKRESYGFFSQQVLHAGAGAGAGVQLVRVVVVLAWRELSSAEHPFLFLPEVARAKGGGGRRLCQAAPVCLLARQSAFESCQSLTEKTGGKQGPVQSAYIYCIGEVKNDDFRALFLFRCSTLTDTVAECPDLLSTDLRSCPSPKIHVNFRPLAAEF